MWHRRESELGRERERRLVRLGRVVGFQPAEADAEHAAVSVLRRVADGFFRVLQRIAPDDVRGQADLDSVAFARFLRTVAVAAEDLVHVDPAPYPLGRREDALEVHGAV